MIKLINCLGKTVGKLVNKADADSIVTETRRLEAEGYTPIAAERQAVQNALDQAIKNGEEVLRQVRAQRPNAHQQALDFWNKETIRRAGIVPSGVPRFITEAGLPAAPAPAGFAPDAIVAVHNAEGGSTINAAHGNLANTNSYSVSIFPDLGTTIPGKNITAEQVGEVAAKAQAAGIDVNGPNVSIGTWYDAETDTTYVDVVLTTTNRERAIELGAQFNQKVIFDLENMAEIPTGGTGEALAGLPSIAERLAIVFASGYITPSYARETQVTAEARGAPAEAAPEGVGVGAEGRGPEVGGVPKEESQVAPEPEEPTPAPISDEAQEIVNGLPEEQRNAAQKGFARDDRDPMADSQRRKGRPVKKRWTKPIAPEKNTKLVADASKYGLFDKTPAQILQNIASDPKVPRWKRLIADLFLQIGLGQDIEIRMVNTPGADWGALYHVNHETGKTEILVNLTAGGKHYPDLVGRLLHEFMHHGTFLKLGANESDLTPTELAGKRALQKIHEYVRSSSDFTREVMRDGKLVRVPYGEATRFGAAGSLKEFVSEIFSNAALVNKLNSVKPDGKVSLLARVMDAFSKMLIGERAFMLRSGMMLEAAMRETLKVAGSPGVETQSGTAAMQERRSRAARLANAFPNFQEEIGNIVAPMANNMGISDTDVLERELDHEATFYSDIEQGVVENDVDVQAKKINATEAEIKNLKERIGGYVKYYRAYHPAKTGWANSEIKVLGLDEDKGLRRGPKTKLNPTGIYFELKFKNSPYTYARDTAGKPIPRFLKQGKPDKETGKPIDNPEWAKRRQELGQAMFENLQGIMARRGEDSKEGRIAQVILDQINWYRDMREHLRVTFGSMSDYVADVIAGFSPITDVPGNWANMIDYFYSVQKGDYDKAFQQFDEYISADPENRSSGTYKKEFPPEKFPDRWPRKLYKKDQPLFGANTGNALTAGLDMWRAVQTGTAPKARNFGLNLLGISLKATIDRWAARYLQRMHAPTWRLPPKIEGSVSGKHMAGENVELVAGDFGMGQDVFEDVAKRLQGSGEETFKNVTAADLQAILWFAEKELWEMNGWTDIMGAGSSMNELAKATAAQRYEIGAKPGQVTRQKKKLMGEIIGLRDKINGESHVLGAKMLPSMNVHDGKQSETFDADVITHPEFDPDNAVGHVAEAAARLGKDAAHISRVIVNQYEINPDATLGLHIFFKGRVGDAEIKGVLDKLKEAGFTNGITLSVDPRVRPEIIKSLDPATGANQYNGARVQLIPEYGATGGMTQDQLEEAFENVTFALANDASIAESRVLRYDTLVLKKNTDYDNRGKLTKDFSNSRKKAWVERAKREGAAAATRRDDVQKAIDDRKRQDSELADRVEREEAERAAAFEKSQRERATPDPANDGGIDRPTVAAMQYEDEQEPTGDPHGGRTSLVRSMVDRLTNASRDRTGIEVPQSESEVRGAPDFGGRADKGRKGSAPLWGRLGATFRKREAALYQRVESAARLTEAENPDARGLKGRPQYEKEYDYENSQRLFDYLSGKAEPTDPELKAEIAELRKEIPTVPLKEFTSHRHLDSGVEADVQHDTDSGVVYKLYGVHNGQVGKKGAYVPGQLSLGSDKEIRISMGPRATVTDLLGRMERSNSHGLTPNELVAVTPEGQLVFAQPFVEGRGVTQKNMRGALARAGVHFLSEMGGTSGVAKLDDGRWVVYDDLHPGNVRTMPGGRVEIIDANNRELDSDEVADLHTLEKMPPEKPLGPPKGKPVSAKYQPVTVAPMVAEEDVKDDTNLTVAPMAGRGSRARTPWPWQEQPDEVAGYKRGGWFSPQGQLSRTVGYIMQEHKAEKGAIAEQARYLVRGLEKAMKKGFGGKPTKTQLTEVQTALGNIDNRLTEAQYNQARQIKDPAQREIFIRAEHQKEVAAFKLRQQAALNALPDVVRESVNELRRELDKQSQEVLRDTNLDPNLKARISADQGVFLHSNSYQHFENDVWGKYILKSNHPDAVRIRRAAETLFGNEIVGELAQQYIKANPGTSNAAAIAAVSGNGNIPQMVKTRLADYLRKDADEITRIHMLTGKMPVTRSEGGKLLSLQREGIPKEIRELWGQWDEPKANFVKTYSLLARHNADIRTQNRILAEGTAQGYIWKRSTAAGVPLPDDLVKLGTPGDHGPLADAYGPQLLKDGIANYNHPAVVQLFTGLNRLALMSKTIGSIASGIHNLLGNVAMTIANGNLLWAVVYMPKGVFISLMKGVQGVLPILPGKGLRDEMVDMVRLGVFDSDITLEQTQSIYHAMEAGAELEKRIGTAGGFHGALKMLERGFEKTGVPVAGRWAGRAFKNFYIAQDNFWKYINYRVELSKQHFYNKSNPTPLSLEEMKVNAARMVQDTLPSRERVSEAVRRTVGSESVAGQFVGPFFTFPLEAGRTVVNNVWHGAREVFYPPSGTLQERAFGAWRVAGMLTMLGMPYILRELSKLLGRYSDEDEEALRNSLPDYQKNSSYLVMLPRDKNGVPRYMDISYLNPYGYYHSSLIAGYRAWREGDSALEATAMTAAAPFYTVQPGIGSIMDIFRNSDSTRAGAQIWNPEDTKLNIGKAWFGRAAKGFAPGTTMNIYRTYLASQGHVDPKTGKPLELHRELESFVGMPHVETLDMDRSMASAVGTYKKRMGSATALVNSKLTGGIKGGTIAPEEVSAAYRQANSRAFEIFSDMSKAYESLDRLGMDARQARAMMERGFGTEIREAGMSQKNIVNIINGKFLPVEISDQMVKDAKKNFPEGYDAYRDARSDAEIRYVNE